MPPALAAHPKLQCCTNLTFRYKDVGVSDYGNAILPTSKFITEQPQAVAAFPRASNKRPKESSRILRKVCASLTARAARQA